MILHPLGTVDIHSWKCVLGWRCVNLTGLVWRCYRLAHGIIEYYRGVSTHAHNNHKIILTSVPTRDAGTTTCSLLFLLVLWLLSVVCLLVSASSVALTVALSLLFLKSNIISFSLFLLIPLPFFSSAGHLFQHILGMIALISENKCKWYIYAQR